jgi:hypothetical protein
MSRTFSTSSPLSRGDVLSVETGSGRKLVKITQCTGSNPYTATFRRYGWPDRAWDTIRAYWRSVLKPLRDWRYERCDTAWCPRRAVLETADCDAYCRRHAPDDAHAKEIDRG